MPNMTKPRCDKCSRISCDLVTIHDDATNSDIEACARCRASSIEPVSTRIKPGGMEEALARGEEAPLRKAVDLGLDAAKMLEAVQSMEAVLLELKRVGEVASDMGLTQDARYVRLAAMRYAEALEYTAKLSQSIINKRRMPRSPFSAPRSAQRSARMISKVAR